MATKCEANDQYAEYWNSKKPKCDFEEEIQIQNEFQK